MDQKQLIKGFAQLGILMRALGRNDDWKDFSVGVTEEEYLKLNTLIHRQVSFNGWFTKENVRQSLFALGEWLTEEKLTEWAAGYLFSKNSKRVAVIMAGNIPLVGFHDFLCVLVSGHKVVAKLSSDDKSLLPALGEHLIQFVPELKVRMSFSTGRIGEIDAVIATGSNNSIKYFEQYFGKYPHIFRRNRTSLAVLDGSESPEEIEALGQDIFAYFGLGCRNVSQLLVPQDYHLDRFFEGIVSHFDVVNNNKYGNNYDYNKAVYLLNQLPLLDNNFVLLRESEALFSPLAMVHYQRYQSEADVEAYLAEHRDELQVVVGHKYASFGSAQRPSLTDYADGVDVMAWLESI